MNNYELIEYTLSNSVATIALNRPKAMNALTPQLRAEFVSGLEAAVVDEEVKVIVVTGRGRSFGSGQDLSVKSDLEMDVIELIEVHYKPIVAAIQAAPKPVISAINGACAGVSIALAMAADLSIMADDAYLLLAFSSMGLVPDGGVSWHLVNQLGYKRAYQLISEGGKLSAQKCVDWGMVNKVVSADALMSEAQTWAEQLTLRAPLPLRYSKEILRLAMQDNLLGTVSTEANFQKKCAISADCIEAMQAFTEKRSPVFKGC